MIRIGSHIYKIEVVRTKEDIRQGMRKYISPPPYGMLFPLKGLYYSVTMKGMTFPLDISFYDKNWRVIPISTENGSKNWMRMYPYSSDATIPKGAYYMLEFPVGMIPLSPQDYISV